MSRQIFIAAALVLPAFVIGCTETVKNDPRFTVNRAELVAATSDGFAVPGATEVDLVETMAASRSAYYATLEQLVAYYAQSGNNTKLRWAQKELAGPHFHYRYLMPAEIVSAQLRASRSLDEADSLYDEAVELYKQAGGFLVFVDEAKLRQALEKFDLLISTYPTSDKIDDAAFKAGQIYERFGDHEIAVTYYQRAFQWDEQTPYPTRFKAAHLLDQKLRMRKEALALYRLAYENESQYQANTEFAKKRIIELTRPGAQAGAVESEDDSQ